jgi:hypothetical protein
MAMKRTAMHTKQKIMIVVGACMAAATALMGCELIVDFDRSKIPQGTADSSVIEGSVPDGNGGDAPTTDGPSGNEGGPAEASTTDASDGGRDAAPDAAPDSPAEAAAPDTGASDGASDAAQADAGGSDDGASDADDGG